MKKVIRKVLRYKTEQLLGYSYYCFGCGHVHVFWTEPESEHYWNGKLVLWTFVNNDFEKPTFRASMLVNPDNDPSYPRCHHFVENGMIRYLGDCTHDYKGRTVKMKENED